MSHPYGRARRRQLNAAKKKRMIRLLVSDQGYWPFRGWLSIHSWNYRPGMSVYFKDNSNPVPKKDFKRISRRKVRQYKHSMPKGNYYRKLGNDIYDLI